MKEKIWLHQSLFHAQPQPPTPDLQPPKNPFQPHDPIFTPQATTADQKKKLISKKKAKIQLANLRKNPPLKNTLYGSRKNENLTNDDFSQSDLTFDNEFSMNPNRDGESKKKYSLLRIDLNKKDSQDSIDPRAKMSREPSQFSADYFANSLVIPSSNKFYFF